METDGSWCCIKGRRIDGCISESTRSWLLQCFLSPDPSLGRGTRDRWPAAGGVAGAAPPVPPTASTTDGEALNRATIKTSRRRQGQIERCHDEEVRRRGGGEGPGDELRIARRRGERSGKGRGRRSTACRRERRWRRKRKGERGSNRSLRLRERSWSRAEWYEPSQRATALVVPSSINKDKGPCNSGVSANLERSLTV